MQFIQENDSVASLSFDSSRSASLKDGDILERKGALGQFRLEWVVPDGNCGFSALGISRADAVRQLLASEGNRQARVAVAEDIRQALLQGHLPLKMRTADTSELRTKYFHVQNQIDKLRRDLAGIAANITIAELQAESLRIQANDPQRAQLLTHLATAMNDQDQLEGRINNYTHDQGTYRQFIQEEFGRGAWLSYVRRGRGTLYALALIKGINVHIWRQNAEGFLEEIPLAPGLVGDEIHLLHTNGLTHFHKLVPLVNIHT